MSVSGDECADSATPLSNRVVGAAAWSGLLNNTLDIIFHGTEPFLRGCDANHVSACDSEMPSGHEDMDLCTDKVLSKGRILQELTKAVKLVSEQRIHSTCQCRLSPYTHIFVVAVACVHKLEAKKPYNVKV